jgi:hypothetical protein
MERNPFGKSYSTGVWGVCRAPRRPPSPGDVDEVGDSRPSNTLTSFAMPTISL